MEKIICDGVEMKYKDVQHYVGFKLSETDKFEAFLNKYREKGFFEYDGYTFNIQRPKKKRKRPQKIQITNKVLEDKVWTKNTYTALYRCKDGDFTSSNLAKHVVVSSSYMAHHVHGLKSFTINGLDVEVIRSRKSEYKYIVKNANNKEVPIDSLNKIYRKYGVAVKTLQKYLEDGRFVYFRDGISVKRERMDDAN